MQLRRTLLLFFSLFSFVCVFAQGDNNSFTNTFNFIQKYKKTLRSSSSKTWESVDLNCMVDINRYYQQCAEENKNKNYEERKITRLNVEVPKLLSDLLQPLLNESVPSQQKINYLFLQRIDSLYHKLFQKKLIEGRHGFREINYLKDFSHEEKLFLENFFHGALLLRRMLFPSLKYEAEGKYYRIPRQELVAFPHELWEKTQE